MTSTHDTEFAVEYHRFETRIQKCYRHHALRTVRRSDDRGNIQTAKRRTTWHYTAASMAAAVNPPGVQPRRLDNESCEKYGVVDKVPAAYWPTRRVYHAQCSAEKLFTRNHLRVAAEHTTCRMRVRRHPFLERSTTKPPPGDATTVFYSSTTLHLKAGTT